MYNFVGRYVKEADADIIKCIKEKGRLADKAVLRHSYPMCWRSDTPLIYKAVPSWFVSVTSIKEQLIARNEETYWVPSFVKEKRFYNWLVDAKDWAISRNRFWGTPIPLWVSDDLEEVIAIGSIDELEALSGVRVSDLHRENIDNIEIPSKCGKGTLKRVDEVFDCWFESGSMPYAQQHYPFENQEYFESNFPADFIAEGLDQTRGWFYTLMVISTALFDKPAFKNLICNGLVLAADGKKMSKRLKNYPPPENILSKYGADALRLYLISSPVVRAEPLRFKEDGVLSMIKDVFLPWLNAFRFMDQNMGRISATTGTEFIPTESLAYSSENIMDKWIHASLQGLIKFVHEEMEAYRLYTVMPALVGFIENLTNWYVRLNRNRIKGSDGEMESKVSLSTLYIVLLNLSVLMGPFTPFFTEFLYQHLRKLHENFRLNLENSQVPEDAIGKSASVHFCLLPTYDPEKLDEEVEKRMKNLFQVVDLGRQIREKKLISLKTPIKNLTVVTADQAVLDSCDSLKQYIQSELNIWDITLCADESEWSIYKLEPKFSVLGKRVGKDIGKLKQAVQTLSSQDIATFMSSGTIDIVGHTLSLDDVLVKKEFKGDASKYYGMKNEDGSLLVVLDITQDEAVFAHANAREIVSRIQRLRKACGLKIGDQVEMFYEVVSGESDEWVRNALKLGRDSIIGTLKSVPLPASICNPYSKLLAKESFETVDGKNVSVMITKPTLIVSAQSLGSLNSELNVNGVNGIIAYLDYPTIKESPIPITINLDGIEVEIQPQMEYFFSALEMIRADPNSEFRDLC